MNIVPVDVREPGSAADLRNIGRALVLAGPVEVVVGTVKELHEHAALMRKFPEMEHADPNQLAVDPGKTGELLWQFTKSGTFDFACLQPGHYEAGMHGKIAVK